MSMRKEWEMGGISKYDCIPESQVGSNGRNSCHCICYIHYVTPLVLKPINKDTRKTLYFTFYLIFSCNSSLFC